MPWRIGPSKRNGASIDEEKINLKQTDCRPGQGCAVHRRQGGTALRRMSGDAGDAASSQSGNQRDSHDQAAFLARGDNSEWLVSRPGPKSDKGNQLPRPGSALRAPGDPPRSRPDSAVGGLPTRPGSAVRLLTHSEMPVALRTQQADPELSVRPPQNAETRSIKVSDLECDCRTRLNIALQRPHCLTY